MSDGEIVVKLSLEDGGYKVAVVSAGRAMKEFKQSLDSTASSIKRVEEHQFSLGRKFRDLVMTMGALRFVAMDVNDVFLRLPMSILKSAGELERMQVLMKGLSKELTEAGRAAEGLRDFQFVTNMAKSAPFEIAALSDSFVKLKTAGIDPTNGSMKSLVDAVARFGGTGESLKRASIAIQQMAGKGVISMEELRQQLGEAVPTAMQDMADGMGVSMAELAKIVQTGTLAAGPAIAKMLVQMRINNEGAAAGMMKTWVGMTSRLKTEWDLAAKSIADAGFADEAKQAVGEIIALLQSDDFKRFGIMAGETLGTVVKDLVEITKVIAKYREEITMLVQAWLAYKALTSIIVPTAQALSGVYSTMTGEIGKEIRAIKAGAISKRLAAQEAIALARTEEAAVSARTAHIIRNKQTETEFIRVENARILADYNRLQTALAAADARRRGGVTIAGTQGALGKDVARARLQDMRMEMDANSAAMRNNAREIANQSNLQAASTAATGAAVAATNALTSGLKLKTAAAGAAALASRGLGLAVGLMGGTIGVTITAVMALVWWFQRAGAAADEAKARMDRASKNMGTAQDLIALNESVIEAERKLTEARSNQERGKGYRERNGESSVAQRVTNQKAAAAEEAAVLAAEKKLADLRVARGQTQVTVIEESGRERATAIDTAVGRVVTRLEEGAQLEIRGIEQRQRDVLNGLKKDSKEYQAATNKFNAEKRGALVKGMESRVRAYTAAAAQAETDALKGAEGSAVRSGGLAAARRQRELAEQMQKEIDNTKASLAGTAGFKPKKDDKDKNGPNLGDKDTPFGRLVESIAADAARLKAELDNFNELDGKADTAAGIAAKLRKRWEQNEFKDPKTGKNPTEKEFSAAVEGAMANRRAEEEQKKLEELAQKAKDFAEFVKGMEPEYLDAIEVLMDPLGKVKVGRSEKKIDKMLAGMTPEELQAAATRMGTTVDNVRAELMNKAQTIDTVSFFQNVAQETEQLNASMVDDSREAAVARMKADNDRHAQEMKNLYEKRQASGEATGAELLQLQNIMEASIKARAAKLANESRSPLEKLGAQWGNVTKNMEEATSRWAESAADAFTNMAITGKMNFKDMAISILADLAKIQIKAALSPWLNLAGNFIAGMFGGGGASPGTVDYSLGSGGGGGLGLKLNGASFANGGIMTEFGSAPLKKYANGGIANSPQLALFGEGKTPEAYVPLPDGRSIPVTLKGLQQGQGGSVGDSVQINITINEADGGESSDATGDMAGMYQQMGERIKSVVREELLNQKRPGGVLYK